MTQRTVIITAVALLLAVGTARLATAQFKTLPPNKTNPHNKTTDLTRPNVTNPGNRTIEQPRTQPKYSYGNSPYYHKPWAYGTGTYYKRPPAQYYPVVPQPYYAARPYHPYDGVDQGYGYYVAPFGGQPYYMPPRYNYYAPYYNQPYQYRTQPYRTQPNVNPYFR